MLRFYLTNGTTAVYRLIEATPHGWHLAGVTFERERRWLPRTLVERWEVVEDAPTAAELGIPLGPAER